MKPFMMATALAMLATPAYASGAKIKDYKKCIEGMQEAGIDRAQAKRACNLKIKPDPRYDCDRMAVEGTGHCE